MNIFKKSFFSKKVKPESEKIRSWYVTAYVSMDSGRELVTHGGFCKGVAWDATCQKAGEAFRKSIDDQFKKSKYIINGNTIIRSANVTHIIYERNLAPQP